MEHGKKALKWSEILTAVALVATIVAIDVVIAEEVLVDAHTVVAGSLTVGAL